MKNVAWCFGCCGEACYHLVPEQLYFKMFKWPFWGLNYYIKFLLPYFLIIDDLVCTSVCQFFNQRLTVSYLISAILFFNYVLSIILRENMLLFASGVYLILSPSLSLCLQWTATKHRSRGRLSKGHDFQNHSAIRGENHWCSCSDRTERRICFSHSVFHFLKASLIKWK